MKVSVCIASHNMKHLLPEAIDSCLMQDYGNIEIVILDDASSDNTNNMLYKRYQDNKNVSWYRSDMPSGTGGAFNKAISHATGSIIVLLCADDYFTDKHVISDIVREFEDYRVGHVSRYYYQFLDGKSYPVRAWRTNDIIELANNPSGLAFRASAIKGLELSNKMFIEAANLVSFALTQGTYKIIPYDTVAVRIHQSISRNKNYYLKRWVSSPVEEWAKLGGSALLNDFTSLIQIKNYFTMEGVLKECWNFIKYKPSNLINPAFWFFATISILTPRFILKHIPDIYRKTWGRWTTRIVCRPS